MIDLIKQLRDETGVSIGKCKEALEEAGGDMEKAREILRTFSASAAAKKSDRELGAGTIGVYVHSNRQTATLVSLLCETDFVAKNEDFVTLANDLAMHITAMSSTEETVREEPFIKDGERTIQQVIEGAIQKLGERIEIGTIAKVAVQ